MILYILFLSWAIWQAQAAAVWPCSQQTTRDANGNEIWECAETDPTQPITYYIRDYGVLRPTLVYNCFNVPSLCNNVAQYGPPPLPVSLHYDADKDRKVMRRDSVCPTGWTNQLRTNGENQCPEPNQPTWRWKKKVGNSWVNDNGPQAPIMFQKADRYGTVTVDKNRLASVSQTTDINGVVTTKYTQMGAVMSCDEWPAASWIEGGAGDIKSSTTYCAPIAQKCAGATLSTEQNWQAFGHAALVTWFERMVGNPTYLTEEWFIAQYSIFKFDFRTETVDNGVAVYVEVNGQNRYCYGLEGPDIVCNPNNPADPAPTGNPAPEGS